MVKKRGDIVNAIRRSVGIRVGIHLSAGSGYISTHDAEVILAWIVTAQAELIEKRHSPNDKDPARIHSSRTPDRKGNRGK